VMLGTPDLNIARFLSQIDHVARIIDVLSWSCIGIIKRGPQMISLATFFALRLGSDINGRGKF